MSKNEFIDYSEYEDVFDEDGNSVTCDRCSEDIKWKDGEYVCPSYDQIMSRSQFFNYIGANIPGDGCLTCNELYPGCATCPNGYIKEDEF